MGRHEGFSRATSRHADSAKPLVAGTIGHQREPTSSAWKELITRRSRVQIPPPLLPKNPCPGGCRIDSPRCGGFAVSGWGAPIPYQLFWSGETNTSNAVITWAKGWVAPQSTRESPPGKTHPDRLRGGIPTAADRPARTQPEPPPAIPLRSSRFGGPVPGRRQHPRRW